jgi:hypothetical protein
MPTHIVAINQSVFGVSCGFLNLPVALTFWQLTEIVYKAKPYQPTGLIFSRRAVVDLKLKR